MSSFVVQSADVEGSTHQTSVRKRHGVHPVLIGIIGMILVPVCIVLPTNSWTTPDGATYARIALGSVTESTLADVAAW